MKKWIQSQANKHLVMEVAEKGKITKHIATAPTIARAEEIVETRNSLINLLKVNKT